MGFGVFGILFTVVFMFVTGIIIANAVRSVKQWHSNNQSPRLTVEAEVVAKRTDVSYHNHNNDNWHNSSTWYFATFEVESGDRMELSLTGSEYGMLAEGDKGRLSFQGTRFLGFERS